MHLLVTAEDQAEIEEVDIYFRSVDEDAFPGVEFQAVGIPDSTYPYEFDWDIQALPDGQYEFYASALDGNGNRTMAPTNPYRFSINRNTTTVATAVALGSTWISPRFTRVTS
jgi:hypothetical protein